MEYWFPQLSADSDEVARCGGRCERCDRGWRRAGIAAVTAGKREVGEELGSALVKDGAVVTAGLVAKGRGEPALADAGRSAQDQVLVGLDPVAVGQLLEQCTVEAARGTIVDVLDRGLMAQPGIAQAGKQTLVAPIAELAIVQQSESFRMGQSGGFGGCFDVGKALGHAGQPELMEKVEGRMGVHDCISY